MIFSDYWIQGLKSRQQNLIVEYVLNEFKIKQGLGGYKSTKSIYKFLESKRGRTALNRYIKFAFDNKKEQVKMLLMKIHHTRATYNPSDIIDKNGKLMLKNDQDLRHLGELAFCIDGIKHDARGKIIVELADRTKSLPIMEKMFDIYDENDDDTTGEKNVFSMSDEERRDEIDELYEKRRLLLEDKTEKKPDVESSEETQPEEETETSDDLV